jgi:hypothetical protein
MRVLVIVATMLLIFKVSSDHNKAMQACLAAGKHSEQGCAYLLR